MSRGGTNEYQYQGEKLLTQIRAMILFFIVALVLSGVTAFPIESQLSIAHEWIQKNQIDNLVSRWLERVYEGVQATNIHHPFIAYGTDWLAFAHLVIAVMFIGPWRDPVKNIWIIQSGIIACIAIYPLALIAGSIRGIPWFWQLIDCSFGLVGALPLIYCYLRVRKLEQTTSKT